MEQAVAALDLARIIREHTPINREVLGHLTGLRPHRISELENGRRQTSNTHVFLRALRGLGVPDLALSRVKTPGETPPHEDNSPGVGESDGVRRVRQLVAVYDLPEDGPTRGTRELTRAVSSVVDHRLNSRYCLVLEHLPQLLPELTRALHLHHGADRAHIAGLLTQAYRAADAAVNKRGFHDLSGRLLQVMWWAAQQSEDEVTLGTADYVRTETFFATRQYEAGHRMLERTINHRTPGQSSRGAATYGALHMRAAVAAARAGKPHRARDHLGEARSIAGHVAEGIYDGTAFGPGSVHIHEVTLALDLGAPQEGLAAAAGWAPPQHLPAERRSHFYIDIARAQSWLGRYDLCVDTLATAGEIAPEHVRVHPHVHTVLAEVTEAGTTGPASAARQFASALARA